MEKNENKDNKISKEKENERLTTTLISPEVAEQIFVKFGDTLPKRISRKKKKNNK